MYFLIHKKFVLAIKLEKTVRVEYKIVAKKKTKKLSLWKNVPQT